jgi:hypothetical protein
MALSLPPLTLYVHLPWCVRKCPYCDFNSHVRPDSLPEDETVAALLADLEQDLPRVWGRTVHAIFFGGGTPSLFSARAIGAILDGVSARVPLAPQAEITLEANPGTVEHDRFEAYRSAGVNRISLGVQSFDDEQLSVLGRIHGGDEAKRAIDALIGAGFDNFNVDLMWALPGQDRRGHDGRSRDRAGLSPAAPVALPADPGAEHGVRQAPAGAARRGHGLGDAGRGGRAPAGGGLLELRNLGLGAAGPGEPAQPQLLALRRLPGDRRRGRRQDHAAGRGGGAAHPAEGRSPSRGCAPRAAPSFLAEAAPVAAEDLAFEFMLNRLRLAEAIPLADFRARTGLDEDALQPGLDRAVAAGLLERDGDDRLIRTERGAQFLNDLQAMFLPEAD